ncbi:MAG: hypothetical protein GX538_04360 [Gammaproteobacteria bacterium]|nr:hypothetical protein [Gammaproteobacteria bacterium]
MSGQLRRDVTHGADELIHYREDPERGAIARMGGHVALIGVLSGVDGQLPLGLALGRQLRLQALIVGSRPQQQEMVRAMEASPLDAVRWPTHAWPLDPGHGNSLPSGW